MGIPKYDELYKLILDFLAERPDRYFHIRKDVASEIAERLGLTEEERNRRYSPKMIPIHPFRVGWACWVLDTAGLAEKPRRGYVRITSEGRAYLEKYPGQQISMSHLRKNCPRYREWEKQHEEKKLQQQKSDVALDIQDSGGETPEEKIESAYKEIQARLKQELLDAIMKQTPDFFESLVIELLRAMGYGGGDKLAEVTGGARDEGIDGLIHQDALGLDVVYLQAKRYGQDNEVSAGTIRDFIGSLSMKNAQKGVFITTSGYTKAAKETLEKATQNIVAIDGNELVGYMIKHGVGVREERSIKLHKIDNGFFEEE